MHIVCTHFFKLMRLYAGATGIRGSSLLPCSRIIKGLQPFKKSYNHLMVII